MATNILTPMTDFGGKLDPDILKSLRITTLDGMNKIYIFGVIIIALDVCYVTAARIWTKCM